MDGAGEFKKDISKEVLEAYYEARKTQNGKFEVQDAIEEKIAGLYPGKLTVYWTDERMPSLRAGWLAWKNYKVDEGYLALVDYGNGKEEKEEHGDQPEPRSQKDDYFKEGPGLQDDIKLETIEAYYQALKISNDKFQVEAFIEQKLRFVYPIPLRVMWQMDQHPTILPGAGNWVSYKVKGGYICLTEYPTKEE